ncbi:hypothetical protein AB0D60_10680 [Streptomyces sp. NPDC048306]|uniref:hypothetical protein n=1 Tax=Streptomyces sp. NPDC048306 TaxID=3154502 RepID=UPI0033CDD7BF
MSEHHSVPHAELPVSAGIQEALPYPATVVALLNLAQKAGPGVTCLPIGGRIARFRVHRCATYPVASNAEPLTLGTALCAGRFRMFVVTIRVHDFDDIGVSAASEYHPGNSTNRVTRHIRYLDFLCQELSFLKCQKTEFGTELTWN